ncbi:MAG TPA: hypothetical protein VJT72_18110 [Pseudonocardiaceae bacterium]|nr:hypothetical protein [Pseudonocardiaceae bacterium]
MSRIDRAASARTRAVRRPHLGRRDRGSADINSLLATVPTHSWVLVNSAEERTAALATIHRFLEQHSATRNGTFGLSTQTLVQQPAARECVTRCRLNEGSTAILTDRHTDRSALPVARLRRSGLNTTASMTPVCRSRP